MTTKQEIIDFLTHPANQFMNIGIKEHLIKMLKDLKPEIKVKQLPEDTQNNIERYSIGHYDDGENSYFTIQENAYGHDGFDVIAKRKTLEEAKEARQNYWNEYVLSLVEVE